jgi:plastocyanin
MLKHLLRGLVALPVAVAVLAAPAYAAGQAPQRQIFARDACDPVTFDQALGAGACTRSGGLPFQQFISQLTRLQRAPAWRFTPDSVELSPGQSFVATNAGGETHTFTEVAQFGGGFVPQLNQLSGNLTPALLANGQPACSRSNPELNLIAPGQSTMPDAEDAGVHLYQCCIHPWMHAVLRVR